MLPARTMGGRLLARSSGAVLLSVVAEVWVSIEERRLDTAGWLLASDGLSACALACLACQRAA